MGAGQGFAAKTNIKKKHLQKRTAKGLRNALTQAFEVESPPWDGWSPILARGGALGKLSFPCFVF